MIELKNYQEKAIEKMRSEINELLEYSESKICVFKSPTGSGKTLMVAEFLKRLVTHRVDDKKLSFIWISVNKLHDQSKNKLEKYYEDSRVLRCSEFDDLDDKKIGENEILFFNWQSINKKDNIYIRENEKDNNLSNIVENTKEEGRDILLIIDESHHTAKAEKSKEVIEAISPKITLEVSATPQIKDISRIVEVDFEEVKAEGMIKTEVSINPEIDKLKLNKKSTDELVISCALKKRLELLKGYQKEGSNVNPLVLIQLPDSKKGVLDRKEDIIDLLREKFNITVKNRRLAIYLSDKDSKVNLENIEKADNETEVLIFKQAIALGWDCPRASVLVLFRDWKSIVFSIQTVGRIMRMPEFKHYDSDVLNKGYVFTNLADIEIAEDIAKDYITVYEAKRRNDIYESVDLNSVYLKRQREKTRLSGKFSKMFFDVIQKDRAYEKIDLKPSELVNEIMVDGKIVKLDKVQVVEHKGELKIGITDKELQYMFDLYIRSVCHPFAPADSSGRIKTALYKFFENVLKFSDYAKIQQIILSKRNNQLITDCINKAKEDYKSQIVERLSEHRETIHTVWNVPLFISYNSKYKESDYKKSIMKPAYVKTESKLEKDFVTLLEEQGNKVKWWFKNGEGEIKYFAIKYLDDKGLERAFYVDFVVMMKDGRIGLFDTKSGFTAQLAKEKAEALARYIKEQNKKHKKKLWGGIVTFKDGSCRYNDSVTYGGTISESQAPYWKYLSFK
ncbi:MAG: DEAD/DEAH box helicase [Candidatus Hodarchaeales archaeon]